MLHASLLTCFVFFWSWIRNTAACLSQTPVMDWWLLVGLPLRPERLFQKTTEKKAPEFKFWGLSGKAELLVLVFAGGWCQKRSARRQRGPSFCALGVCAVSVVNFTRGPPPPRWVGDQSGESWPCFLWGWSKSRLSLCRFVSCGSSGWTDGGFQRLCAIIQ